MRYISYGDGGGPEVLRLAECPVPEIGPRRGADSGRVCRGESPGSSRSVRETIHRLPEPRRFSGWKRRVGWLPSAQR